MVILKSAVGKELVRTCCLLMFFVFWQSICVPHESHLISVLHTPTRAVRTPMHLPAPGVSSANDQAVCYGTSGVFATGAKVFAKAAAAKAKAKSVSLTHLPPRPVQRERCHSEPTLLWTWAPAHGSLIDCVVRIQNSTYPPCRTQYGGIKNFYTGEIEYNPGTTCHDFLLNFAYNEQCTIIVGYDGGTTTYNSNRTFMVHKG
jgi:hypothetical protein